jgi:hypothetical protein
VGLRYGQRLIYDTEAELQSASTELAGDIAYCKDTKKTFICDGIAWTQSLAANRLGAANGVASLGADGKIPTDQINLPASSTGTDATSSAKGIIQLAGDLGGTAAAPTVPGLAGKAAAVHGHTQADILNLVTDLAGKAPTNHTHTRTYAALASGTVAMAFATNAVVKVTPTAASTFTTTVPPAGTLVQLMILTAGIASFVITFGAGFKAVGTLATGTTANRVFVINFISDGTNLYESGRTAAMVA